MKCDSTWLPIRLRFLRLRSGWPGLRFDGGAGEGADCTPLTCHCVGLRFEYTVCKSCVWTIPGSINQNTGLPDGKQGDPGELGYSEFGTDIGTA